MEGDLVLDQIHFKFFVKITKTKGFWNSKNRSQDWTRDSIKTKFWNQEPDNIWFGPIQTSVKPMLGNSQVLGEIVLTGMANLWLTIFIKSENCPTQHWFGWVFGVEVSIVVYTTCKTCVCVNDLHLHLYCCYIYIYIYILHLHEPG
jgi:hypothetical protein